jgi:hypothetical protein
MRVKSHGRDWDSKTRQSILKRSNTLKQDCVEETKITRRVFLPRIVSAILILIAGRGRASGQSGGKPVLRWESGHPERKAWSDELRQAVDNELSTLEKARDIQSFAPNYLSLSRAQRIEVWASIFVGMARFETVPPYDPTCHYREADGYDSIGLLQLSFRNQWFYGCESMSSATELEDPLTNIRCGVRVMAFLTDRDKVIASGSGKTSKGGASYWSTLRDGPRGRLTDIKNMVIRYEPPPRRPHVDTPHGDSFN